MTTDTVALDEITARLRQSEPVIDGGDFTTAVLAQLPRADALPEGLRHGIVLGATGIASALVARYSVLPSIPDLLEAFTAAAADPATALLTAGALTWGAALAALCAGAKS